MSTGGKMRKTIGKKLIAGFLAVMLLIIALAFYSARESEKFLQDSAGKNAVFLAQEMLKNISRDIYINLEKIQTYSGNPLLKDTLLKSNQGFENLDDIKAYIDQRDEEWRSVPKDEITPFMQRLISNTLSNNLREKFIEFYEKQYGYRLFLEVFVTNKYGANVAQTQKTSDYRQDDEKWWQAARAKGLYVSDIGYDESTGVQVINVAASIHDEAGEFIGAIKGVVSSRELIRWAEITTTGKHETAEIELISEDGKLIYATEAFKFLEDISENDVFKEIKGETGFFIAQEGKRDKLFSYAHSRGFRDFKGLPWILVLEHDVEEILAPAFSLRNKIIAVSLILIGIGFIVALFLSRSITVPLGKLRRGVEIIGKGDMEHRVPVETRDEIGELAGAFNEMADKRLQVEAELYESEAKYRSLAESLDQVIYRTDPETIEAIYVNKAVERIYGYTVEEWLKDPALWESSIYPEDKERVFAEFTEARKNIQSIAVTYRIIRKDKTVRWVEDHASWEKGQQGNVVAMNGVMYDITERKKAEEELVIKDNAVASSINAIAIADLQGNLTYVNPSFLNMWGFDEEKEVLGKKPQDFAKYPEEVVELLQALEEKGGWVGELIMLKKDGAAFDAELTASLVTDERDEPLCMMASFVDITERKRAKEALERRVNELSALNAMAFIVNQSMEEEEILNRAMDEVLQQVGAEATAMLLLDDYSTGSGQDNVGELALVAHRGLSKEFVEHFGRMRLGEGLAGRVAQTKEPVVLRDLAEYPEAARAYLEKESIVSAAGVPLVGRAGVVGVMNLGTASPHYFDAAGLDLLVGLGRQIAIGLEKARLYTETRAQADELRKHRDHLEELVEERTAELKRSNEELEQFAYIASHDLQEPLRMVSSYTQLLEKRYKDHLDQDARDFIHFAVDGSKRMQMLINDLLSYSRVSTRGGEFELVDFNSALGEARADLKAAIEDTQALITNEELPTLMADEPQVVRLFQNLIGNALKFRGEAPPMVHVSAQERGDHWLFSVSDNGMGIDPEYHERIFTIFQRLKRGEECQGTGIGLAICKRIVNRHGGDIRVESQPGEGSTFYFTISKRGGKQS